MRADAPGKPEPVLEDDTIVTRDVGRIPTMEVPFPEAEVEQSGEPVNTRRLRAAAASAAAVSVTEAVPIPGFAPASRRGGGSALGQQFRTTLTNVRAYPLWRRRIPPALFLAVVIVLVFGLLAAIASIRSRHATLAPVDRSAEMRRERERRLRTEGNELVKQGKVDDAYKKFEELARLAPSSPAITTLMQKLNAVRRQQEISNKQLAMAKQKYDEGIAAYNQKKYSDAIALLQESFHLNPNSEVTAAYLKLAQQQETMEEALRQLRIPPVTTKTASGKPIRVGTTPSPGPPIIASGLPAQLTTVFDSPFSDGYIMVKAGGDVVAHENLWEQKGRFFRRQTPRVVNVTRQLAPRVADVEVWVVVPSLSIQEHRVLKQSFLPGTQHRLVVSFNQASRKFDYQLN
jgi:hypothetical protein